MRFRPRPARLAVALVALLATTACAGEAPPPATPTAPAVVVEHRYGVTEVPATPPQRAAVDGDPATAVPSAAG
jgi:ABC-type Fe3+-hydroxamate transport system substrate-binding protein